MSALMLAGISPGCASRDDAAREEMQTGRVGMALTTFGSSGRQFRLRNAKFRIDNVRTGEKVKTLNSEKDPEAFFLTAELESGEYSVTLQKGWFLERVGFGGGGTGGPEPFPNEGFDAGSPQPAEMDAGVAAADDVAADKVAPPVFPRQTPNSGVGSDPTPSLPPPPDKPGSGTATGGASASGGAPSAGGVTNGGAAVGGGSSVGGTIGIGGSSPEFSEVVNAQLISDAIVRVFIEPNGDSFIFYSFIVGDDLIQFGPGRLNIGIDVFELEPPPPPPPQCDSIVIERRALFETTLGATSAFTMRDVFSAISGNEGFMTPPELLYGQIIDSYSSEDQARLPDAVHCGDEMTGGQATLNGFPITCDRQERFQFDNMEKFFPTGIVNRFELAPENGAHCGNQSLVFASNAQNRMFFIFEAQIPNPNPDQGIAGCQPIANFWATQAQIEDPVERGQRLRQAFLTGLPELEQQGVGPFVSASHYTIGSGQIRTNQFDQDPWTLREFRLAVDGSNLSAIPFPVGEAPNGQLWNDNIDTPQGPACREAFIGLKDHLLIDDLEIMDFPVPEECRDAESRNDSSQNYPSHLLDGNPNGFFADLEVALEGTRLTPIDFAARAQFAGSCIGCHTEAQGQNLGRGVFAPFSNGFTHVDEFASGECADDACFQISQGLRDVLIPSRKAVLTRFVDLPVEDSCNGNGGGDDGGAIIVDPPRPGKPPPVSVPAPPAPVFTPELPSVDEPIADMVEQDVEIRKTFGAKTLGGQSTSRTH